MTESNVKKSEFFGHRYNIPVAEKMKKEFTALCEESGKSFPIREDMSVSRRGVNLFGGRYVNAVIKYMIAEAVRLGRLPFDTTPYYKQGESAGAYDANIPIRISVEHKDEFARICKAEGFKIAGAIRFYVSQCVANQKILVSPEENS